MEEWTLIRYETIDSTNAALKTMTQAPHGTILCSTVQTAGRGRLGRSFHSSQGGLYLSLLLKRRESPDRLLHLTPMVAVAVRRAIRDVCSVDADIKWINDLQIQGKKICGILTEIAPHGGIIIGIGINCNTESFPEELRSIAGSLSEFCGRVNEDALLQALILRLKELDRCLIREKAQWLAEYKKACITLQKEVLVISPTEQQEAFAEDLGENGEIIVRFPDGTRKTVFMGEVSLKQISERKETV